MEYRTPILVAFTLFIITLCYFYYKKTKAIKDKQMEETLRFADFKDENKHFTSEKFDACSDKDLVNLIVALIGDLEDEDENFLDKLNMEERTVYGISQLNECVSTTKTIRSFFETPAGTEVSGFLRGRPRGRFTVGASFSFRDSTSTLFLG